MCHHVCWGGSALLNSEAREWSRVLLFHHRRPRGSCDKRGVLSVEEALGSNPLPHPALFCIFCLHPLFISELFISHSVPDFFFSLVEILPQSVLRNPPGPAKTRWNAERGAAGQAEVLMIPFFSPSFFWTTLVKVCFIYTAASHNKSDLMTLSKYSRSRFKS